MSSRFVSAGLFAICLVVAGWAQSATEPQMLHLAHDPATGAVELRFWGHGGRIYFLEHSEDLYLWNALPDHAVGADAVVVYQAMPLTSTGAPADKFFFRLGSILSSWPEFQAGDFDGDGLSNAVELQAGLNPFSRDTDRDGLPDGYELAFALDPFANDASADADGDGVPNREDARPNAAGIGRLAVSIATPLAGSTIP